MTWRRLSIWMLIALFCLANVRLVLAQENASPATSHLAPDVVQGELARGASAWQGRFAFNQLSFTPGDTLQFALDVTLTLPDFDPTLPLQLGGEIALQPVADARGIPIAPAQASWSSSASRSGLPVLGVEPSFITLNTTQARTLRWSQNEDAPTQVSFRLLFNQDLPANLEHGWYQVRFTGTAQLADSAPFNWYDNSIFSTNGAELVDTAKTAITIPQWLRVGDAEEPRLVVALFDDVLAQTEQAGIYSENRLLSPLAIRPAGNYDLTPRLITQSARLKIPSGQMRATITAPDGTQSIIGNLPVTSLPVDEARRVYLSTDDPRFNINFEQYGVYNIVLSGTIQDVLGMSFVFGGEYSVAIAEPLMLEAGIFPATPFAVGDTITPALQITPAMPAEVRVVVTLVPLGGGEAQTIQYEGFSNQYGYFTADAFTVPFAGEYIMDYRASASQENITYASTRRLAGVLVAPDTPDAQGQRGIVGQTSEGAQAWYDTAVYPDGDPDLALHAYAPFFSSDILYLPDDEQFALQPIITQAGTLPEYNQRQVTYTGITQGNIIWQHQLMGGSYMSLFSPEQTIAQIGSGIEGVRAGDVAWLMGGWAQPDATYGYASAIIVTDDDSLRIVPAHQVPLISVNDVSQVIRLHTSGVQSGTILQRDDPLTLAGYLMPTSSAQIDLTLVSPSGRLVALSQPITSNRWGYWHVNTDLLADEAGIWRANARITYTNATSAGALTQPIQADKTWQFYVVNSQQIRLTDNLPSIRAIAPAQNLTLNFDVPDDWQDINAHITIRTPSETLVSERTSTFGNTVSVTFNRADIVRRFPNIEGRGLGDTLSASDAIIITVYATGTDAQDITQHTARTITLWHDTLYTFANTTNEDE
jgi:hypothetical protein